MHHHQNHHFKKSKQSSNHNHMEHVKIKRVKRHKKQVSAKEKVLAGLGVGSTLMGGIGAVAPKAVQTQFVRTQQTEKSSAAGKIKESLKRIFGVGQAKAMAPAPAMETLGEGFGGGGGGTTDLVAQRDASIAAAERIRDERIANLNQWRSQAEADAATWLESDPNNPDAQRRMSDIEQAYNTDMQNIINDYNAAVSAANQVYEDAIAAIQLQQQQTPITQQTTTQQTQTQQQTTTQQQTQTTPTASTVTGSVTDTQTQPQTQQTTTTNRVEYDVWRTDAGVGAYYDSQYGFVTLTNDNFLIDQNGNNITSLMFGNQPENLALQTLMWHLKAARDSGDVQNPNITDLQLLAASKPWQQWTSQQQAAFTQYYSGGQNIDQIPSSFGADSAFAYGLGWNGAAEGTTQQLGNTTYKLQNGQWVKQEASSAAPVTPAPTQTPSIASVITKATTTPWDQLTPAEQQVFVNHFSGDQNISDIPASFAANSAFAYALGWSGAQEGSTSQLLNTTYKLQNGQWVKQEAGVNVGTGTQVERAVTYGANNLSYTVRDNEDGTFSVIYNGQVLVTGSTKADIDAARARYPSFYATPEAVILSNLSLDFDNLFARVGSQTKLDTGNVRPVVSTTAPREVFRDSYGNSAAYFGELGGRVYYDAGSRRIFWEKSDGSMVDITYNPEIISPKTSADIISILSSGANANITITGFNDGRYPANYNLLTEMGVGVEKGLVITIPTVSNLQPGIYQPFWNLEGFTENYTQNNYPFTVTTAKDPSGQTIYTFSVNVNGQQVNRTFIGTQEINNFLNNGFATADAYLAMSPQDKAIFNAAINARLKYPEIGLGSRLPVPGTNHSVTVTYQRSDGSVVTNTTGMNPAQLSFREEAEFFQKMFPGSRIVELEFAPYAPGVTVNIDPNDPRRNYQLVLPDGTSLNVGLMRQSTYTSAGVIYLNGLPPEAAQYFKPPADGSYQLAPLATYVFAAPSSNAPTGTTLSGAQTPPTQISSVQAPVIDGFSQTTAQAGSAIVIYGSNFDIQPTSNLVSFDNPAGTTTFGSTFGTELVTGGMKITVPSNLPSGTYTIHIRKTSDMTKVSNGMTLTITNAASFGTLDQYTSAFEVQTPDLTRGVPLGTNSQITGDQANNIVTIAYVTARQTPNSTPAGSVASGYFVEIGGNGLTAYNRLQFVVNHKDYDIANPVITNNKITFTMPDLKALNIPNGSHIQVRLLSDMAGVKQGILDYVLVYNEPGTAASDQTVPGTLGGNKTLTGGAATVNTAGNVTVGQLLGTNQTDAEVSQTNVFITHATAFDTSGKNSGAVIQPGFTIEIGGTGLDVYNEFHLWSEGQDFKIQKAVITNNKITLTIPELNSLGNNSQVQVKLLSSQAGVQQGLLNQTFIYRTQQVQPGQDNTQTNQAIQALQQQVTRLENRIKQLSEQTEIRNTTAINAQVQALQNEVNRLRSLVNSFQSGQVRTFSAVEPMTQGLQMPSEFSTPSQGLQMPAGFPASEGYRATASQSDQTQSKQTYKVKKGDTLWGIAKKVYGDGSKWRKILEANPKALGRAGDTRTLRVGAELVIPEL